MATVTSLYLCNRTLYAAVGRPAARGAKICTVCSADLPEGCLINGVVTNEEALYAGVRAFFKENSLPADNVALVLNGSRFVHQLLTLPAMPDQKLYKVLEHELGGGTPADSPQLVDYMLLAVDPKHHTKTLLASRAPGSIIESCLTLAKQAGFKISAIDLALCGQIKAVSLLPALAGKTFITLQFDGENLYAALYVSGMYSYSTRSRLLHRRGTPESGVEIAQKLSGIVQFHTSNKTGSEVTAVYFSGAEEEDLDACAPACEPLQLTPEVFPDCDAIALPQGCRLADALIAAGNLIGRS